jgi:hypothetical protein
VSTRGNGNDEDLPAKVDPEASEGALAEAESPAGEDRPAEESGLAERLRLVPGFEPGTVAEVYRKGFTYKDRLLRPALVKVASEGDDSAGGSDLQ